MTEQARAWSRVPASGGRGGPCRCTTSSATTPRCNQGRPVRVRSGENDCDPELSHPWRGLPQRRRCDDVDPRRPRGADGDGGRRAALVRPPGLPRPLEPAGVGHTSWRRWGRAVGVSRGVSPAELRRLYQWERLAAVEIGERFGVSGRTVHGWLRQLGIAPRPQSERRRRHRPPIPAELRRRYVTDGLSTGQLARCYGVSASTVARWLEDAGISRRPCGRRSQAPAREELRRLYQAEGLSTAQIGERYRVSQQTAHRWVRAAGVPLRPQGQPTRASTGRP
jgi:transposase